jgi:hypothetical protein
MKTWGYIQFVNRSTLDVTRAAVFLGLGKGAGLRLRRSAHPVLSEIRGRQGPLGEVADHVGKCLGIVGLIWTAKTTVLKVQDWLVDATGIEPVTPSMSTRCSPAELRVRMTPL